MTQPTIEETQGPCTSYAAQYRNGEHRLDPNSVEFFTYHTEYVCMDCGETVTQFNAGQGG